MLTSRDRSDASPQPLLVCILYISPRRRNKHSCCSPFKSDRRFQIKSFLSISDLIPLPPSFTPLSSTPVRITKAEHDPGGNTTAKNDPHAYPNPKSYLPKTGLPFPSLSAIAAFPCHPFEKHRSHPAAATAARRRSGPVCVLLLLLAAPKRRRECV
ncbi:unnamed protein product, partial [Ectocarpus sp. 4 AP-2014]